MRSVLSAFSKSVPSYISLLSFCDTFFLHFVFSSMHTIILFLSITPPLDFVYRFLQNCPISFHKFRFCSQMMSYSADVSGHSPFPVSTVIARALKIPAKWSLHPAPGSRFFFTEIMGYDVLLLKRQASCLSRRFFSSLPFLPVLSLS